MGNNKENTTVGYDGTNSKKGCKLSVYTYATYPRTEL